MSTEINMGEKPKRLHIGLTGSILIALGLGLLCGVIFHYLVPAGTVRDDVLVNGIFYVVGQGFIRLMQMLVVPLVFCSIVCGASSIGDTKTLGTIGLKTLAFYLCTTALAVTVALSIGNLIKTLAAAWTCPAWWRPTPPPCRAAPTPTYRSPTPF